MMNSLRARLSATVVAVLIIALLFLSFRTAERAQSILEPELERKAATVAGSTAALINHAIEVGIPFDQIEGLDPYLEHILESNPDLSFIAVRDATGRTLYGSESSKAVSAPVVTLPIGVQAGRTEVLAVGLDPGYAREIVSGLWVDLVI